ncbi:MAG: hypothetical protein AB8G86_03855 [Saprospiraceae bacterium]
MLKIPLQTWIISDRWLLNHIVKIIENQKNIVSFNSLIGFNNLEDGISWLNDFFIFCIRFSKTTYLSEHKVYPNQLGDFSYKTTLYKDENIAEELKDVLENLDKALSTQDKKGWRHLLLDKKITAFENVPQNNKFRNKTTQDISDEINKKIPSLKIHSTNSLKATIFHLVTLAKSENTHQRKLWEYLRTFYFDEVPPQIKIIDNAADFDWKSCFLWCIERLMKDITALKYVDELADKLRGNIKVLDWLHDVVAFIQEEEDYKKLLDGEEYAIIPNQNRSFQIKNRLWIDNEINEDLKQIIQLLNPDWLDDLPSIFLTLPRNRERNTLDAAVEVNRIFRNYKGDTQKHEYVKAFRIVSNWMDKQELSFIHQHIDWIHRQKAEIALSLLGSDREKDEVFQIIESGKAPLLSKIANNENFS